jgi:murein DD-endopeptidase MepM/ murein hydrolase activator NlpD
MNKLGFYTEWFGADGVVDAIRKVEPPTLVTHMTDIGALRSIRGDWSPDTFIVGRPYILDPGQQDALLDSPDPAGEGRKLAERILREFPMATELVNGRLLVDAWMAVNESVPGPASDVFHKNPDLIVRRAMAYDAFERAFQNRLLEHGLQAVAFNFGAGNWLKGEDYIKYFPQTLDTHVYLGFHEYGWPAMNPDEPGTSSGCGLYRQVMPAMRAQYGEKHKVIITEAGLARMYAHGDVHPNDNRPPAQRKADVGWLYPWDSVAEEAYKKSLRWYNDRLLEDDYVLGACLFQVGPGGDWVTFRHTGQDNQGRPLTLMDELAAMAQEPAPKKKPVPPKRTLVETLRTVGEPLIIPLNPDAMLYKIARQNNLGERLTGEYEATYQGQTYIAQLYERGLAYVPVGQWNQAQVALNPEETREMAAPPEVVRPLAADGFDFPVGIPDGRGYYVAADLVNQAYYVEHQSWHTGEDWNRIAGPGDGPDVDLGDLVYAVAHGQVVTSQTFPIWGNVVLIEHRLPSGQMVWSQYAHLRQRLVSKGDIVRRGTRIGTIGKGDADRYPAHLHFEIRLKKLAASKRGWQRPEDRDKVLAAYAHPTNFINAYRPRAR